MSIDRRQLIAASLATAAAAALPLPALAQSRGNRGPLDIRNPQTLSGMRQAVLGSIVCAYFTERRDRSHAGGGFSLMRRADVATISNLNNVTDADFIAATDAVYAALLERLAAAGVTLADRSAFAQGYYAGNVAFAQGAQREAHTGRDDRADIRLFAPSALGGGPMILNEWLLDQAVNTGVQMSQHAFQATYRAQQYARSSGVPVLNLLLLIDFANAETFGGVFALRTGVTVRSQIAVWEDKSQLTLFAPDGKVGRAKLREPVNAGGAYGEFVDATTRGQRTGELVGNIVSSLLGGGTSRTRRMRMDADPAAWREGVGAVGGEAIGRMLTAVAAAPAAAR